MRSKAVKDKSEKKGFKTTPCPYCGEMVSNPKSISWMGGRICKEHFCIICKKPVRPDSSYKDAEGNTICLTHKCISCGQRVRADRVRIHGTSVVCKIHYCSICGGFIRPGEGIILDGKPICDKHPVSKT